MNKSIPLLAAAIACLVAGSVPDLPWREWADQWAVAAICRGPCPSGATSTPATHAIGSAVHDFDVVRRA